MKEFRTEIKLTPAVSGIKLSDKILTQGSCFAEAIGSHLTRFKFKGMVNPFGVIYNPESIHQVLAYSIFNEPVPEHTYLTHDDVHLNYNFHSKLSALNRSALISGLINTIGSAHYFLKDAEWLILTYGTAWVYRRKETGEIVANCHKQPSGWFTKSLLSIEEILSSFQIFYQSLKKFNPAIRIVLTVSPVRHLKDTLTHNTVSKSILRLACHSLVNANDDVGYFPAYEIMMDDLRDYRFYERDMIHPTAEAEDYIWEKFVDQYLDGSGKDFLKKWAVILAAINHRPFHAGSPLHQQFLKDTLKKLEELKFHVDVEEEALLIKKQII